MMPRSSNPGDAPAEVVAGTEYAEPAEPAETMGTVKVVGAHAVDAHDGRSMFPGDIAIVPLTGRGSRFYQALIADGHLVVASEPTPANGDDAQ